MPAHSTQLIQRVLFAFIATAAWFAMAGQPWAQQLPEIDDEGEYDECEQDEHICYGPCDCEPLGTLLQWSRCASFSGGPDLDEPLVTDRPDFTEASSTVGMGVAQLEFGYTYSYDFEGGDSTRTHSFGEPLLRVGMFADWFEFRIAIFPLDERTRTGGVQTDNSGLADLYIGAKIALTPQECWLPEMAIIPQANLPTGDDAFTSDHIEPGINWIYSWEINDCISTAGSTQINRRIDENDLAYTEMAQSWTIAYTLTDNLGAYTEWFVIAPSGAAIARTEHYFNGGFTYLLTNDVQWDIRAGKGLNAAADDYFLGTGLSIRFGANQCCE